MIARVPSVSCVIRLLSESTRSQTDGVEIYRGVYEKAVSCYHRLKQGEGGGESWVWCWGGVRGVESRRPDTQQLAFHHAFGYQIENRSTLGVMSISILTREPVTPCVSASFKSSGIAWNISATDSVHRINPSTRRNSGARDRVGCEKDSTTERRNGAALFHIVEPKDSIND